MKTKSSNDMTRKLLIIESLVNLEKPSMTDISTITNIPRPSVQRQIFDLRNSFLMDIRYVREKGTSWQRGHYEIYNWGLFSKERVLAQLK